MTRFGFFLFHILLIFFVYGLIWVNGAKPLAISYMLWNFTVPYLILILLMLLIATVRWFMSHDPEIGKEIATWAIALLAVPALNVAALYLIGGISGNFWHSLHNLMTLR
jgi:hypothetical protein